MQSKIHNITRKSFLKVNLQRNPLDFFSCLCYGCPNVIWGGAINVAKNNNIGLIIMGESDEEDAIYKKFYSEMLLKCRYIKIRSILKKPFLYINGKIFESIFKKKFIDKGVNVAGIEVINFFDYNTYHESKIVESLITETGWESDVDTNWRFDCEIHILGLQFTYQLMGMTEWDDLYSIFIRKGEISREEALHRVSIFEVYREKHAHAHAHANDDILKKLGLDVRERNKVLKFLSGEPRFMNEW